MHLNNLPTLLYRGQSVVAVESPLSERVKVLKFISQLAQSRGLPLYFWNQGYCQLQEVDGFGQSVPTDNQCTSGLTWLLQHRDVPGVFAFEGVISPDAVTGVFSQQTVMMLSNLVYDFTTNPVPRLIVCLESYVELPVELAPLIPVLVNPLPSAIAVKTFVGDFCNSQFATSRRHLPNNIK
jgi:hypothetical protein